MTLPKWQTDILAEGELYRVGGHVRDGLLGIEDTSPDTDFLVRGLPPERLEHILLAYGKLVLVGKAFGSYRFTTPDGVTHDLVYPRLERSTGPGHRDFDVHWDWTLPVEEDLRRRDFTVNAVAERVIDGAIVDPTGGRKDAAARVLRMIFPEAFDEDPLRILRGVRFSAQFGLDVEPGTFAAMRDGAGGLATLSAERVQEELTKLLARCVDPGRAFRLAREMGALAVVLPELDRCAGVTQNEYHPDDVFEHSVKTCDAAPRANLAVRWAALLHDVGKVDCRRVVEDEKGRRVVFYGHENVSAEQSEQVLTRLKYSSVLVARCRRLVQNHMFQYESEWTDATVRRFMRRVGPDHLDDLFRLREADCRSRDLVDGLERLDALRMRVRAELDRESAIGLSALAIRGGDVMKRCGVPAGPDVGRLLERALDHVLDRPEDNRREILLELVGEWARNWAQKNRKPK